MSCFGKANQKYSGKSKAKGVGPREVFDMALKIAFLAPYFGL
jgi:hypothetical protein